jgi:hypothetical protein
MVILDKVQGKIECIAAAPSFSVGTLITYTIRPERTAQFISDSALVYAPLSLAQADILFFHHVIELIYYFTQIGNCAKGVFELLSFLYATEHETITTQFKKIFLLKLLTCMGSVPDLTPSHTDTITYLNTMDLQQINTVTIDTLNEKKLDRWLWCCVWQHPYVNEFKTVHFLAENRAI